MEEDNEHLYLPNALSKSAGRRTDAERLKAVMVNDEKDVNVQDDTSSTPAEKFVALARDKVVFEQRGEEDEHP